MPITIKCGKCGYQATMSSRFVGKVVRCPSCQAKCIPPARPTPPPEPEPSNSAGEVVVLLLLTFVLDLAIWAGLTLEFHPVLAFLLTLFGSTVPAWIGRELGMRRVIGSVIGFVLGFFLGWLGVLIILFYPSRGRTKPCPYCAERISIKAIVCKHCGRDL